MTRKKDPIEVIHAALAPHGIFLRGILHFDGDGPELRDGERAATVVLLGNAGGSVWPAFAAWRETHPDVADPLDSWSVEMIRPVAEAIGATAWFPSEKPWQPFQQWAMRAEGLKPSPLGILVHPRYGLWHGYRGAIGLAERVGQASAPLGPHPCDSCADRPCLRTCPVSAIQADRFNVPGCRTHIKTDAGRAGCMVRGCIARNACPVGAEFRYQPAQLQFHMAALS